MCGIVGISGSPQAAHEIYQALLILQHRGQDSAGIVSVDSETGKFHLHKSLGHVAQVFGGGQLKQLAGTSAIGQTRYSTIGDIKEADLQPMAISVPVGIGMVHNGNVSNYSQLRTALLSQQQMFLSDNDLEIILRSMAESFYHSQVPDLFQKMIESVRRILDTVEGGYSAIGLLGTEGMFGFRDPHGIRPLIWGTRTDNSGKVSHCLASETSALKFLGFEVVRDLFPGELIWIDRDGKARTEQLTKKTHLPCMFEWVYFSSADSILEKKNVYQVRLRLAELMAKRIPTDLHIDLVSPVPDTSRPAAIGLAETLKIPFREVLLKNRYVQRSFILNGQNARKLAVEAKFAVVESLVKGKNVLLVDDSIVRGTTSEKLVRLLKHHGANKVYFASTCPPIIHPCFYGIDFASYDELIAVNRTPEEVAKFLGADGVFYADLSDLSEALEGTKFCSACLDGKYAYPVRRTPPAKPFAVRKQVG